MSASHQTASEVDHSILVVHPGGRETSAVARRRLAQSLSGGEAGVRFLRARSRNGVLLTRGNHVTGIRCACYGYFRETQRGVRCIHENRQPRGPHPLQSTSKGKGGETPPRQTRQQIVKFFYEARLLVDLSDTLLDLTPALLVVGIFKYSERGQTRLESHK